MASERETVPRADDMVVAARDLVFAWERDTPVLDIPEFSIARGEKVFLKGPSGSGKSTLLGLIGGVLEPQGGHLTVLGQDLRKLNGPKRDALRATHLGVIFQMFNLLPFLSLLDNVTLPCRFSPARRRAIESTGRSVEAEAERLLAALGLDRAAVKDKTVRELSVGQQQRVAAARALIGGPALLIADEPTSALDTDTRDAFLGLLIDECDARGSSLLFVSHDAGLTPHFDRSVDLMFLNRQARETAP